MRHVGWWLAVLACNDTQLSPFDPPPQVTIIAPEEGQRFDPGVAIELVGIAEDAGGSAGLEVTWTSAVDGRLGGAPPDTDGNVYWVADGLTPGDQVVTLEAVDANGAAANTSVGFVIEAPAGDDDDDDDPPPPGAPTVVFTSPAANAVFLRDEEVSFAATVSDAQQAPETLLTTLTTSIAGVLWEGAPTIAGTVSFATSALSIGVHDVELAALDADGNTGRGQTRIEVLNDGRPFATIDAPLAGTVVLLGDAVTFEGTVSDLESDAITLQVEWTSDRDGVLSGGFPDSAGYTAFATTALSAGIHVISLTAIDPDGQNAADTVIVEVSDPNLIDGDLDGYTPAAGDCDDTDVTVNPGAAEVCDEVDNDCDLLVNEHAVDTYEPGNDFSTSAHDLGEIDDEVMGTELVGLAGLTMHTETDEDWFGWDADDDWYDDISIVVTATFPPTGEYVLELYWDDGGTLILRDSAAGNGTISVDAVGSSNPFDEDEDDWKVRVVPAPGLWDPAACSSVYSLDIES